MSITRTVYIALFSIKAICGHAQDTIRTKHVEAILYHGKTTGQTLVVGLGGSEGGNAWASDHWKSTRNQFIEKGYSFLALAYFGAKGTPPVLEKIALEDIHHAILTAASSSKLNKVKIAVIGGSRGADLALLLGSYYSDISCVVGLVSSHVSFPGHTDHFTTSCWTFQDKELPFVPVNEEAIPFLIKRDLRGAFEAMLKDSIAEEKALIKVENISGPILLMSATKDEICPSTPMAQKMMTRLRSRKFSYPFEHIAIEGKHAEPLKHFDIIFSFLETNFNKNQ